MNDPCYTYERVMSHIWMSHGTHTKESWHTYEWVTAHIRMRHVTHMNDPRYTYERVMPHVWMSRVTHMNESCHTYEWVMPHIWMSHGTHMNESRHTYEWVMSQIWMRHVTHMNESCHKCEWVMSHVWLCHGIHMNTSCYTHVTHMNDPCYTYERVMSHMWMSRVTHMNESLHTLAYEWVTANIWMTKWVHSTMTIPSECSLPNRCWLTTATRKRYCRERTWIIASFTLLFPLIIPLLLLLLSDFLLGARIRLFSSRPAAPTIASFALLISPPVFLFLLPSGARALPSGARLRRLLVRPSLVRHLRHLGLISFPFFLFPLSCFHSPHLPPVFASVPFLLPSSPLFSRFSRPQPFNLFFFIFDDPPSNCACHFLADIACHYASQSHCVSLIPLLTPSLKLSFSSTTGECTWDPGPRVFTTMIIIFPSWWLSCSKHFRAGQCNELSLGLVSVETKDGIV